MKLRVDQERCQGHSRCYSLAPELFDVDDSGQAHERFGGEVPPHLEGDAHVAIDNCPELAIVFEA